MGNMLPAGGESKPVVGGWHGVEGSSWLSSMFDQCADAAYLNSAYIIVHDHLEGPERFT